MIDAKDLQVKIDTFDADTWNNIASQFSDATIYQSHTYGATRWGTSALRHITLIHQDQVRAAAQFRILTLGIFKIAYLTWGPMWQRKGYTENFAYLKAMIRAIRIEFGDKRKCYIRMQPSTWTLQEDIHSTAYEEGFFSNADSEAYRTVIVNLHATEEELRKNLRGNWRRSLQKAETNSELSVVTDSSMESLDVFLSLYNTMRQFKSFHDFASVREFMDMQQHLPADNKLQVTLCYTNGVPASGAIWTGMAGRGILLFLASSMEARKLQASYPVIWRMMLEMKARDCQWYDGGGIHETRNPGGAFFKKGVGGTVVEHVGMLDYCKNPVTRWLIGCLDRWRDRKRRKQTADVQ